jgi:hypothetical protein
MSPTYGGWGGRYVWRQFYGEPHPFWTQGGDAFPGRDSSRDTVIGVDGKTYTSDQATIWRWRGAFQNDFAARMDWTINDRTHANHNPIVIVNGQAGTAPIVIEAKVGVPITLDASPSSDPDGDAMAFAWFFYPEAGTGIPTQPVVAQGLVPVGGGGTSGEGGIPSAPAGLREPAPRVLLGSAPFRPVEHVWLLASRASVTPKIAGIAHVILAVTDGGTPSLTSYRRIILRISAS